MGTVAKGTALFRAGAAHPRGCPGRRCSAAGAGRVSGRVPGRAVRPGAAGGGRRAGISAGAAGTAAARPCCRGDSRLPPRPAGAGKQRRVLPLPAGGRGRPVADGSFGQRCGGVLRYPQPPVPHRGHHARRTPGRAAALGSPRPGTAVHHRGRLRLGVPLRHPPAAQLAGHGGRRRPGGVPVHLLPQPCPGHPHCLYGAAPAAAGRVAGQVPAVLRHGRAV